MQDDDPEKRIRELERGLADVTRPAQDAPYTGGAAQAPSSPYYYPGPTPPRRNAPIPWLLVLVVLGILVPVVVGLVALFVKSTPATFTPGSNGPRSTSGNGPTTVPNGGELRVGGNMETKTVACNDGTLTLYGYGTTYSVTGHCASLTVGGYNNNVTVGNADSLESTGYSNTVTDHACNNCKLTLSSYGIAFNVTGHAANLTISSYDNKVTVDSVDTINVSGYDNNVTYHSGTPKITDSGYSNTIQQG